MTLQKQIVALAEQGLDNGEISQRLGCRREYVRVAKRRAGLAISQGVGADARLERRIKRLEAELADARRRLRDLRKTLST